MLKCRIAAEAHYRLSEEKLLYCLYKVYRAIMKICVSLHYQLTAANNSSQ
jgi:hypothetical protein